MYMYYTCTCTLISNKGKEQAQSEEAALVVSTSRKRVHQSIKEHGAGDGQVMPRSMAGVVGATWTVLPWGRRGRRHSYTHHLR